MTHGGPDCLAGGALVAFGIEMIVSTMVLLVRLVAIGGSMVSRWHAVAKDCHGPGKRDSFSAMENGVNLLVWWHNVGKGALFRVAMSWYRTFLLNSNW